MPPSDPPTEVTVRVKVPPGHIAGSSADEFTLGTVSTSAHIGELRQQIQQLLPSHPSPDRQRLLYAGRALVDNDQTLATALNTRRDTSQNEYVLHLLVKGEQDALAGQGVSSRRAVGNPGIGGGLSAGHPQDHGNHVRIGGQPGEALPHGPPQGVPHQLNLHQAQIMAMRMQQQAQLQMQQQVQMQQLHAARHAAGMPPGHPLNPVQFAPGQHPPRTGPRNEENATPDQGNAQRSTGGEEGVETEASQQDGVNEHGARPTHPNSTSGPLPQPAQGPHRPVSGQGFHVQGVGPNGNRFEIHQQTLNIPFPGQQAQFGLPMPGVAGMGLPFPLPGMAQQPRQPNPAQQANGPSALDRARQNVAEMRQMVEAMRNTNATEEDRARTARLQEHIQAVNDYIDPFRVGRPTPAPRSTSPFPARMAQSMRASPSLGLGPFAPPPHAQPMVPNIMQSSRQQPSSSSDTTCYLLSSPQGPQALLFSPQHGTYTGSLSGQTATGLNFGAGQPNGLHRVAHMAGTPGQPAPTPTQPAGAAHGGNEQAGNPPVDPAVAAAQQIAQQINQAQQAQARADNPGGPLQPLLAHFWLLLRIMIFGYFIIGTNMGWRRPVALATIALGFYLIRAGLFGDGGVARRWWDGIVRVDQRPRQQAQAQGEAAPAEGEQRPGQLPTPEEVAQRLLQERQQALDRAPLHRIREHLRPVERAGALFFASFWPGVGEAHVRAREAEERRLAEEEVEQRRREEEERQRAIEAAEGGEKKEEESAAAVTEGDEKPGVDKEVSASAPEDVKEAVGSESLVQEPTEQAAQ